MRRFYYWFVVSPGPECYRGAMEKKTIGTTIAELRKKNGMTQAELAEKLGITDKAVSKWERDLSCPDIATLPKLCEILGISVDELMQGAVMEKKGAQPEKIKDLIYTVLRALSLAMGVAVAVISIVDRIEMEVAAMMLGFGLACLSVASFLKDEEE